MGEIAFDILPALDMFGCISVVFYLLLLYFIVFFVFRFKYLERIAKTASGINSLPIQEDPLIFKSLTVGICFVANNATCNFGGMKS